MTDEERRQRLSEYIRPHFGEGYFDSQAIAAKVWLDLCTEERTDLLLVLIANEVGRLHRDDVRSLEHRAFQKAMDAAPTPELPVFPKTNPYKTLAAVRKHLSGELRELIEVGVWEMNNRTIAFREATLADIEERLALERSRLIGQARSVHILEQLRSFFDLGITTLGDLL